MDESKPLEEIRTWEHPPWYGSDQFEEKFTLIFLENQKGLFHHLTTLFQSINDFWSMSGNFIYRHHLETRVKLYSPREDHSLVHWNTLTFPELLIQTWMSSKRNASMIIRISMGLEICQILGQVSHNLLYWKKKLPMDICGPGRDWRENG